jgi:hypothetical protein
MGLLAVGMAGRPRRAGPADPLTLAGVIAVIAGVTGIPA